MHELALADSARPARFAILGVPLLEYSLGHELLLISLRNPVVFEGFAGLGTGEQSAALIQAVLICSRPWEKRFRPRPWFWWKWFNLRNLFPDYALAAVQFTAYRLAGSTAFPVEPSEGGGRSLGAPAQALVIQFVARAFNLRVAEAHDFPYGYGLAHYYAHLETEGALKIPNAADHSMSSFADEHDAAFARDGAAGFLALKAKNEAAAEARMKANAAAAAAMQAEFTRLQSKPALE